MPIEPHHAATVTARPMLPRLIPATEEQYRANIFAHFGHPPAGMDLAQWLARMENRAMRAAIGTSAPVGSHTVSDEMRAKLREASHQRGIRTMQEVLAALTEPMTREDLMSVTGMHATTVQSALNRALDQDLVRKTKAKTFVIWERSAAASPVAAMNAAKIATTQERLDQVAAYLSKPRTSRDVATHLRVTVETAQTYLRALRSYGRAENYREGRRILWTAAAMQEAAE